VDPQRDAQDKEERREDVRIAFRNEKLPPLDEMKPELQVHFTNLTDAVKAQDGDRLKSLFDFERLYDELDALGALPPANVRQRASFIRGLGEGFARMPKRNPLFAWATFEIKHIRPLDGGEAAVIVRHRGDNGSTLKIRWWL